MLLAVLLLLSAGCQTFRKSSTNRLDVSWKELRQNYPDFVMSHQVLEAYTLRHLFERGDIQQVDSKPFMCRYAYIQASPLTPYWDSLCGTRITPPPRIDCLDSWMNCIIKESMVGSKVPPGADTGGLNFECDTRRSNCMKGGKFE